MAKRVRKQDELAGDENIQLVIDGLSALFKSLTDGLHGDGEHSSVVQEVCRVGTALSVALGEQRQRTKARHRELAAIPIEMIVAHLKTLPDEARRDVCRDVLGTDNEEGIL